MLYCKRDKTIHFKTQTPSEAENEYYNISLKFKYLLD
jgi:hypothetical protein